jgi:hypothetical protein
MPLLNLATPEFFYFPQKNFQQMSGFFYFLLQIPGGKEEKVFGAAPKLGAG